jgi:hypothetical protein
VDLNNPGGLRSAVARILDYEQHPLPAEALNTRALP